GGVDRMGKVDKFDRGAHPYLLGQGSGLAHQEFGYRERIDLVDIDRLTVVLADIGVPKAELVGVDDLCEVLFVSLCRGRMWTKAIRENAKFHFESSISPKLRTQRVDNMNVTARIGIRYKIKGRIPTYWQFHRSERFLRPVSPRKAYRKMQEA